MKPQNNQPLPQAVQSCHDLLLWMIPQLDKFPRLRRYTLGEKINSLLLEILEFLLDATYSKRPYTPLNKANIKLSMLRHLWRLCMELKVIDKRRYRFGSDLITEIGQQTGGWQKYSDGK